MAGHESFSGHLWQSSCKQWPFYTSLLFRYGKMPIITVQYKSVQWKSVHTHGTCYILILAWSIEGEKRVSMRFTTVVTNTRGDYFVFTWSDGHISLPFPPQTSSCKVHYKSANQAIRVKKTSFLSSVVQITVINEPLHLTYSALIHLKCFAE